MANSMKLPTFTQKFSDSQKIQLESLKDLLETQQTNKDTFGQVPKTITKGNNFTKKFLTWNKKQIREKRTFFYAGRDEIFNPTTGRFRKIQYDKRYKNKKVIRKNFKKIAKEYSTQTKKLNVNSDNSYRKVVKKLITKSANFWKSGGKITIDLKKIKFDDVIEDILEYYDFNPNVSLISSSLDFPDRWITLSQANLQRLLNIDRLTHQKNGSDIEYIFNAMSGNGLIVIKGFDKSEKSKSDLDGAFFKYYNKTSFDLSRYDIYNFKPKNYNDNCLFIALKNSGRVDEIKLNNIKDMFRSASIPTNKLNIICNVLEISIKLNKRINGTTKLLYFGNKKNTMINIGLVDNHYFIIEDTEITRYSLEHYEEVRNLHEFNKIYKKSGNSYKKSNKRFISSLDVVRILIENKKDLLERISVSDLMETQYFSSEVDDDILEYDEELNCKINEVSKKDNSEFYKVFYDFETDTTGETHAPYLMCYITEDGRKGNFRGLDCGEMFINELKQFGKKKILLIAHNQRYDFTFILDFIYCLKPILKGSRLMGGSGRVYLSKDEFIELQFQDSLNLISSPLGKFGKMFNCKQEKEILPYDLYTTKNINKKYIKIDECLKFLNNDEDKKKFMDNAENWGCVDEGKINILKYSKIYCEIDCEVLKYGYETFRGWILETTKLNIENYCSIASLANDFMISEGCFDNCYKISGVPRQFIQKCVVGGKVMCAENKKQYVEEDLADYDGVSLYPSSMYRIDGYLQGKPKPIKKENLNEDFLLKQDGFFIKVLCVKNPTINRKFPCLSVMNEEGIRNFTNETEGEIFYLDKTSYEDSKEFQGLEFKILCGYYYDEGRNNQVNNSIFKLFQERLKKKSEGNPIQAVYKLLMNSSYGKTMLKPIDSDTEIIYKKNWSKYLSKNYNFIKEFTETDKIIIVKKIKPINEHFNNVYCGVEILSMSKRIMNEVMYCAEDNKIDIYYTDTDSIHLKFNEVEKLEKLFSEKYGRELKGKNLGQFHIDFDLDGAIKNIKSKKGIFLGKKCYVDVLEGEDKHGDKVNGYHLRMKGIPEQTIHYTSKINETSPLEIYERLYQGEKIKFDLLCGGSRCNFKYNKNLSVKSLKIIDGVSEFQRVLSF